MANPELITATKQFLDGKISGQLYRKILKREGSNISIWNTGPELLEPLDLREIFRSIWANLKQWFILK